MMKPCKKYKRICTAMGIALIAAMMNVSISSAAELFPEAETLPETEELQEAADEEVLEEPLQPVIGELYTFGTYEQDGDDTNGPEDLEWIILELNFDENWMLLLSKNAIDSRPYEEESRSVTWADSSLRDWLNHEFFQTAFQEAEQEMIYSCPLENAENEAYGTGGGEATKDKVFLLSRDEASRYFDQDLFRAYAACTASSYAIDQGCWTADAEGHCWWWLRSPGRYADSAAGVGHTGVVGAYGTTVTRGSCGVRPAIVILLLEQADAVESTEEETTIEPEEIPQETVYEPLQYGDTGDSVKMLQEALIELGILDDVADGQFGPNTWYAVSQFQTLNGLEATGNADEETQKLLFSFIEQKN